MARKTHTTPETKNTYRFNLEYTAHETVTRHADSDDRWDRDDTCTSYGNIRLVQVDDKYADVSIEIDQTGPMRVWGVYAIWSTGDSFGHDECGQIELFGVFLSIDAAEEHIEKLRNTKDYTVPWNGYFDKLDSIDLVSLVITI